MTWLGLSVLDRHLIFVRHPAAAQLAALL